MRSLEETYQVNTAKAYAKMSVSYARRGDYKTAAERAAAASFHFTKAAEAEAATRKLEEDVEKSIQDMKNWIAKSHAILESRPVEHNEALKQALALQEELLIDAGRTEDAADVRHARVSYGFVAE